MLPPRLELQYNTLVLDTDEEAAAGSTSFSVAYVNSSKRTSAFWRAWVACMVVFVVLGGICAFARWWKWTVRLVPMQHGHCKKGHRLGDNLNGRGGMQLHAACKSQTDRCTCVGHKLSAGAPQPARGAHASVRALA